jgi:thiol-disulfide isomerase/thioredoxin
MHFFRKTSLLLVLFAALACKQGERASTYSTATDEQKQAAPRAAVETASGTDVGSILPEYSALTLEGGKWELASKRDKVLLLNVWATWCGPCRFEIPELQAIHEKYAAQGFEVVGVSVDESGPEAVKAFVSEQEKMTYPVVLDAEGKLANMLQTSVLPTSIIVDREGKIVWKKYGAILPNDEELTKAIEKAVGG